MLSISSLKVRVLVLTEFLETVLPLPDLFDLYPKYSLVPIISIYGIASLKANMYLWSVTKDSR